MVALTYNVNRRDKMDMQGLISDLGVPIATSLAMMWGLFLSHQIYHWSTYRNDE